MTLTSSVSLAESDISIGSKNFTESVILSEIFTVAAQDAGLKVATKGDLGGTRILWNAVLSGDIDIYPDYTGTIMLEILRLDRSDYSILDLQKKLEPMGLGISERIGFFNTYAIGMKKSKASQYKIRTVSDLAKYPKLKYGLSNEFMNREDGWPGLSSFYNLTAQDVRGMNHDLAYRALESNAIDIIDLYSTDAEIPFYDLMVLDDDRMFFPPYDAVWIYRLNIAQKYPQFQKTLHKLENVISNNVMAKLNAEVKIQKNTEKNTATKWYNSQFKTNVGSSVNESRDWLKPIREHLFLVSVSMFFALIFGVPMGWLCFYSPKARFFLLNFSSIMQTVPSLALLVLLIGPLNWMGVEGVGNNPAIIALFLYSLLPIVQSTYTGLSGISPTLRDTSAVLGLKLSFQLKNIDFPLALPVILAGIRTALVQNIGFATLGALIGAGGLGQPILTGIRLSDPNLILQGALPATALAVLADRVFQYLNAKAKV